MDPIESTTLRRVLSLSWLDDVEGSLPIQSLETMTDAFVDGGNNVLKNEDVMSAVEALSTDDTALLFHAISQYAHYQTAAVVSTRALQEAQAAYQKAKEYQERCIQNFVKFRAIANKFSATGVQFPGFQPVSRGQQAGCKCFIVHRPPFSMAQAQRRLGVAQPEVTGGSLT